MSEEPTGDPSDGDPPRGWPACDPESGAVQTMVLGTYHMANPGQDVVNVAADDVLDADRQAELEALVDRLAAFDPDRVAVEVPHDWQDDLATIYEDYRSGRRQFDRAASFPDPFPDRFARDETVQVGFRVGDHLELPAPVAVDHDHRTPATTTAEAMERAMQNPPDPSSVPYSLPDPETLQSRADDRLEDATVPEYLRWINDETQLRAGHELLFAGGLDADDSEGGIGMLTAWYERNLRTVRTLWDRIDSSDDRVLLVYGSGHVRALRHFLDEAPMFCPVSPLPYL